MNCCSRNWKHLVIILYLSMFIEKCFSNELYKREEEILFVTATTTTSIDDNETATEWREQPPLNFFPTTNSIALNFNSKKISSHLYSRTKYDECWKEAKCEILEENICFGVKLPYSHTSLALTNLTSQRAARVALEQLHALRNLPHCWSVVQPFICSVLFPECINGSVQLPSQEMCAKTRAPCMFMEQERGWPDFLKCREEFPYKCKTTRELPFNTTGQCLSPLIKTTDERHWYEGLQGCGLRCSHPLLTTEEQEDLHWSISVFGGVSLGCSALTVLTYLIVWKSAAKYPAVIIFYINVCFLLMNIGFMIQFTGNARDKILCHSDGTLNTGKNEISTLCYFVFILVYYPMLVAGSWSIILSYGCYLSSTSLAAGECRRNLQKFGTYFHLFAFLVIFLGLITIFISEWVKPDLAFGICFVDDSPRARGWAILAPFTLFVFISEVFLMRALKSLLQIKLESSDVLSEHANKKLKWNILRLVVYSLGLVVFLFFTFVFHIDMFVNQREWQDSFKRYILCVVRLNDDRTCMISKRPNVKLYKMHIGAVFGCGILMSLWCCTTESVTAWKKFFKRVFDCGSDEPVKLTKHKVIAQAFAKKKNSNTDGRLSITYHLSDKICKYSSSPVIRQMICYFLL